MKLHRFRSLLAALVVLSFVAGCATVTSGDPIVVRAEQSVNIAFDTVDTFLYVEKYHRADLEKISADIHKVAESVREKGPDGFRAARRLIDVYKNNRTDENKANLLTALAFVQALANEVSPYLAKYEAAKGGR
jgi:predicted secreted protein